MGRSTQTPPAASRGRAARQQPMWEPARCRAHTGERSCRAAFAPGPGAHARANTTPLAAPAHLGCGSLVWEAAPSETSILAQAIWGSATLAPDRSWVSMRSPTSDCLCGTTWFSLHAHCSCRRAAHFCSAPPTGSEGMSRESARQLRQRCWISRKLARKVIRVHEACSILWHATQWSSP